MNGRQKLSVTADARHFMTGLLIGTAIVLLGFLLV